MVLNQSRFKIDMAAAGAFVERLRHALGLGDRHFNVCLVEDDSIANLNREFRGKPQATDVLSFPWHDCESPAPAVQLAQAVDATDLDGFLGDVVISVETASRNAAVEGQAPGREIKWLIIHGLLHLLGADHERDNGEMTALEYDLRERLGFDSGAREVGRRQVGQKGRTRPRRSRKALRALHRRTALDRCGTGEPDQA